MKQRQVERLLADDCLSRDAAEQIADGLVLHYKLFWPAMRYGLKCLVSLRCPMCGHRHVKEFRKYTPPDEKRGYGAVKVRCFYGWQISFHWAFVTPFMAMLHGED
jgi:hypothetical protein